MVFECDKISKTVALYFSWRSGDWGACSVTCGSGLRRREAFCKVYIEAWDSIETLDDEECDGQNKPAEYEECDEPTCDAEGSNSVRDNNYLSTVDPDYSSSGPLPFRWRYGAYTHCSASCLGGRVYWVGVLLVV